MNEVVVTIADKSYRMSCSIGEEDYIKNLARILDEKIIELRGALGEIGEMRLNVMAALILIDELVDARQRLTSVGNEVELLKEKQTESRKYHKLVELQLVQTVDAFSERLELATQALRE